MTLDDPFARLPDDALPIPGHDTIPALLGLTTVSHIPARAILVPTAETAGT